MATKGMERGRSESRFSTPGSLVFLSRVVFIAVVDSITTGCGRQVASEPSPAPDLLATGPERGAMPVPRPWAVSAIDAAGGLSRWARCTKLELRGVVSAYQQDGSYYLTEHKFEIYPWSDTIRVSAREPGASFDCQLCRGQYRPPAGDPNQDVSPLRGCYRDYLEVVLQMVTAPVRMLDQNIFLTQTSTPVQIGGLWYQPMEAKFTAGAGSSRQPPRKTSGDVEPYWTRGLYFQNQDKALVDMIWLGHPAAERFLLARGYDYTPMVNGVQIPTRIEVYRSDAAANLGPRLALVCLQ